VIIDDLPNPRRLPPQPVSRTLQTDSQPSSSSIISTESRTSRALDANNVEDTFITIQHAENIVPDDYPAQLRLFSKIRVKVVEFGRRSFKRRTGKLAYV
jgi:hypothetical protein